MGAAWHGQAVPGAGTHRGALRAPARPPRDTWLPVLKEFGTFFIEGNVTDAVHLFYTYDCVYFIVSDFRIDSVANVCM